MATHFMPKQQEAVTRAIQATKERVTVPDDFEKWAQQEYDKQNGPNGIAGKMKNISFSSYRSAMMAEYRNAVGEALSSGQKVSPKALQNAVQFGLYKVYPQLKQ